MLLNQCLCARGCDQDTLWALLLVADCHLQQNNVHATPLPKPTFLNCAKKESPMVFHLKHHPRGMQRKQIRAACEEIAAPHIPNRSLMIAMPRPKNLRGELCSTVLPDVPGQNPSDFLPEMLKNNAKNQTQKNKRGSCHLPCKFFQVTPGAGPWPASRGLGKTFLKKF